MMKLLMLIVIALPLAGCSEPVANNRRFTILDEKGARPNLASRLLGMAIRELPGIWEAKWGCRPLLAETFCDIERTAGTCYRAAGWEEVGRTKGFSRHARDFFIPNDRPKVLFMKPFARNAWDLIVSNALPREYEKAAHSNADGLLPFRPKQIDSLYEKLRQVVDPRASNRKIHIGFLLTAYTMGMAAGAKDLKARPSPTCGGSARGSSRPSDARTRRTCAARRSRTSTRSRATPRSTTC